MFKKIIFLTLTFITFHQNQSFANFSEFVTPTEFEYYKKNQWDFLEYTFIDLRDYAVNKKNSKFLNFCEVTGKTFLNAAAVSLISYFLLKHTTSTWNKRGIIDIYLNENQRIVFTTLATTISIPISLFYLIKKINKKITKYKEEEDLILLEYCLEYYDIDLSKTKNNIKLLIPEEFQPVFDQLKLGYEKDGTKYLKDNGLTIIYKIRDYIRLQLKPEKYKPKPTPQIIVVPTYY